MSGERRMEKRRGERGAAMVEAVVAIPFFVIIFASILFVGQTYGEKLRVMRTSKEKVWTYAMANCGERGDSGGGIAGDTTGVLRGSESNGQNGGVDLSQAGQAQGAPHSDVLRKDVGSATITVDSTVTAPGVLGGLRAKQSSYRKVMCNEPPYDGDLSGTLKAAYRQMTGW
jgi:hypothetical protein